MTLSSRRTASKLRTKACCLLLVSSLLSSCIPPTSLWGESGAPAAPATRVQAATGASYLQGTPTMIALPPSPTPEPLPALWLAPAVPESLRQQSLAWGYPLTDDAAQASLRLDVTAVPPASGSVSTAWVYALVAPFPTVMDEVSSVDLLAAWQGGGGGAFAGQPLWMEESTLAALTAAWGAPAPGATQLAGSDELLAQAWSQPGAWGIIPFEALEPRWKTLAVDGQSPLRRDFDPASYPLVVDFTMETDLAGAPALPPSNRDPQKITILVMTGVTALVRATAYFMERQGIATPGRDIRQWLLEADLTHISNEAPFAEDCPFPDPNYQQLVFCSDPAYIALLEDIGTDIVELTGNHFQDWGSEATLYTLELYRQRGWTYYGGGADLEDASQAVSIEHNGNRLAFIGCNAAGPGFAWATGTRPGAAPCNWDWMQAEVARLRREGYLPVATFQYNEYYTTAPLADQVADYRLMAQAGAVIVSGSQSHVPQGMAFEDGAFVHYGLGNLFFDQMDDIATRREFIDRHVFYDGRYIGVELLTAMLEDYARPRPMTVSERTELLQMVFTPELWPDTP